ncbi:glycoside hydrolase family 13 protein [Actinobacteria bacterium YIM 96077]|uniref:Glycoside hydrolase family 13 protein n=1 Tax=Phytoactinopolyspora halophila TaxID=1981511 RepID=A0A329QA37_9ACTN|nr:glycoside hydrolase family 13 protein [Phytoactinopolyspora halophila]AYY15315.1 glycoside hydrolase family 13 protein [Actinobacteria bacterium YIM 96077]RAW09280.1 glycoside hydrolase family 13 protein [Phytoactinopolyspora halophila]
MLDLPHHDGSARYVGTQAPDLGDVVPVIVDVPDSFPVTGVWVRSVLDGEPVFTKARPDQRTAAGTRWLAELRMRNPVTSYRFLLATADGYRWLTAAGLVDHDVPDATDFLLTTYAAPPDWALDAVIYQVYPDRFARSAAAAGRDVPEWAEPADWDEPVTPHGPMSGRQLFGGDLDGIVEHLDHVADLGVNTLYLTPIFPAGSSHRYDASAFDRVDPLLGGDAALERLSAAVHERGWRLMGDLTTNHCGSDHPWFTTAMNDPDSAERAFFYIENDGSYTSWWDVPSMPKFDHSSEELRARLLDGPASVTGRWLRPPYALDGWRVDVANMTGRRAADDHAHEVARTMRGTLAATRPDALLIAEHNHDASADLLGDGWHGAMNYPGFTRPIWSWLRHPDVELPFLGVPTHIPRWGGAAAVATMRAFAARVPWRSYIHSWSLLGSHDTARIRTVVRDPAIQAVAAGMLFTLPGIPMIFAGDEIGLEGEFGEDARRPMPWQRPGSWDRATLERYRDLIRLRRTQPALRRGGLRWVCATADCVACLRESPEQRLLIMASRAPATPPRVPAAPLGLAPRSSAAGSSAGMAAGASAECVYGDGPALRADDDGLVTLPGDGPGVVVWSLP